ncbi:MAG TPA: DUF6164 family protein [Rhodanobacteraceae bacterium]|nr:DUF6164 family protein [Rhodanobacteraceae bacterium]
MTRLLLNLHDVPRDEVDELTALLTEHGIECYETPPSRWGVSFGGLWVREDAKIERARELMAGYQAERSQRVRDEVADARAAGTAETFWRLLRREPTRVFWTLVGIAFILGLLIVLPVYLLAR